jgi:hypothetical protein
MSGRSSAQESSVSAGAPLPAARFVIAGGRGGMRSTLAAVRGYREARGAYDTEVMRELLPRHPLTRFSDRATAKPCDRP